MLKGCLVPVFVFLCLSFCGQLHAQLKVSQALCENRINPMGVDVKGLHFSWEMDAADTAEKDQYQSSYQLVIASSAEKLSAGIYDVYHSSAVRTRQSILLAYAGKVLKPAQTYYWKVRVWDKKGRVSPWSGLQEFTTGLFASKDWGAAKWIGYEKLADSMRVAPGIHFPGANRLGDKCMQRPVVPLFRKQFRVARKIKNGLLFITGLGQYEVSINGTKTGDAFLSPGWTYYDKRVLYNTYDVTSQLLNGQNSIGVIVGNGFYNINRERYFKLVSAFGMPTMICRLKLTYEDGTIEDVVSDDSWKVSPSPITFSSIYGGEDYDARLEQVGWNTNAFDDSGWKQALLVKAPLGVLLPEQDYPITLTDSFSARRVWQPAPNLWMYDFGQNISGIVRLKVKGKKGQTIRLVPAELLTEKNLANQSASGEPFVFSYTCKGDGEEIWQPKFTYYGFRYVQVEGDPVVVGLVSLHNRNSNPVNGSFECSDELFNRIYTLINWAIKSNLQSVVTDCPHREKLSWLEQDYLMGESIHYNFDIYHLYRKLVSDLKDAQYAKGFVPDIAPEFVVFAGGFLDSPEWGSSAVILPWLLYKWYGDKAVLQEAYPMVKKYVDYLESKSDKQILSHGLGDWFDYGPRQPGEAQLTPKALTATSIYYYDAVLLAQMAELLGNGRDASTYRVKSEQIKKSFNGRFFNPVTKVYSTGSQTAMAMPLCVGLVDGKYKKDVLKNLVDSIYANNKALTAGDIGFHFLMQALDEGGASQLIYDMNNRDDVPGYGFQLKKGATALTESWPALENVSNNHLMLGHIMEWFYSGLGGISQEDGSVAYKHIKIRPQFVGDIAQARASFHSPYGWIVSDWHKGNGRILLHTRIPVNTTATVYLPATPSSAIYVNHQLRQQGSIKINEGMALIETGSGDFEIEVR